MLSAQSTENGVNEDELRFENNPHTVHGPAPNEGVVYTASHFVPPCYYDDRNPSRQVVVANRFCVATLNICGFSVWNGLLEFRGGP